MSPSDSTQTVAGRIDLQRLESMTGFLVRLAQLKIYEAFHESQADNALTPARYSLLAVLHDNPDSRPGQIADALRVKPSNLAALLTQFEQDGLIVRVADPGERRAALIRLSEKGEALFQEVDPQIRTLEDRAVEMLTVEERAVLLKLLLRVAASA